MSLNNETPPPPAYREISADLQAKMNLIIQSEATVADETAFAQIKELMRAIVDSPPASPSWQVDDLQEQLAASRRTIDLLSTFHSAPKPSRGDKIPDPPKFSGTRDELDGFLAQLRLKLYSDESRFPTPSLRMAYTFNRLEGRAQEQILPYVKNNEINLTDTEDIIQILKNAFGDPDPAATARSKLYNLKQGRRDFAVYYAELQGLVAKLGWDERARHDALREGLSIELHRQLLGRKKGLNYEQFVALCQELDVGLRALHHREGKHNGGTAQRNHQNHSQPRTQTTTPTNYTAPSSGTQSPHPDAMDLSATGGRGKVSEQEKAARLREGGCFYCGGVGHMARHCPNKSKNPFRAASAHVEENPNASANASPDASANPNTFAIPHNGSGGGGNWGGTWEAVGTGGKGQSGNA